MNTRLDLTRQPCPLGGTHELSTKPQAWVGASCWKCHRTWEGLNLVPTWADPPKETAT